MRHVTANLYKRNLGLLERVVTAEAFGYDTKPFEIVANAWSFLDAKAHADAVEKREAEHGPLKPGDLVTFPQADDAERVLVTVTISPTRDPRHPEAMTLHTGLLSEILRDEGDHERRRPVIADLVSAGWFYCLTAENVGTTAISDVCIRLNVEAPEWLSFDEGRSAALAFGTVTLAPGETRAVRLTAPADVQMKRLVIGSDQTSGSRISNRAEGIMVTRATWDDQVLLEDTAAGLFAADGDTGTFSHRLSLPYEAVQTLKKLGKWNPEYPWDHLQLAKTGHHGPVGVLRQGKCAELVLRNDYTSRTVTVHAIAMVDILAERWTKEEG